MTTTLLHVYPDSVDAAWSEPRKLGPNVNGIAATHFPFVTADGERLYLSAEWARSPYGFNEDVYVCHWDSSLGDWGPRQLLGPEINTVQRELSPSESPDRQYLWFIRYAGGYDLFYSIWDTANAKWGPAVNAGPQFNSGCIEWSVSISPDGRRMILGHGIRPGTIGCEGQVFWISYWNDATHWWDTLVWMGNVLNAGVSNYSAAMPLDTTFIYFASGQHFPGVVKYGIESDLYIVENSTLAWDEISNIGLPPNSFDRDETVAISADGRFLYFSSYRDTNKTSPDIYVSERSVSVDDGEHHVRPGAFYVSPAWPNPFNASTRVDVSLTTSADVEFAVFNVLGQRVATLQNGVLHPGMHRLSWSAGDLPSGVYLLVAKNGEETQIRRTLFLK